MLTVQRFLTLLESAEPNGVIRTTNQAQTVGKVAEERGLVLLSASNSPTDTPSCPIWRVRAVLREAYAHHVFFFTEGCILPITAVIIDRHGNVYLELLTITPCSSDRVVWYATEPEGEA